VNETQQVALLQALGSRVRERREALGLTRQQLAERAGLHFNYVGSIERGQRNVAVINLANLALALDYESLGELLDGLPLRAPRT
jgi:transcriptional regulator with XRE-family HTH domain